MKDDVANSKRLEIHLVLKRVSQTIDLITLYSVRSTYTE